MRIIVGLVLAALPCPALVQAGSTQAGGPSGLPEIVRVQVGFAGHYKAGLWTPVQVTLRGSDVPAEGRLFLTVPDGEGVPSQFSTPEATRLKVEPGREAPALLYVRFGRVDAEMTVEFRTAEGQAVRRVFSPAAGDPDFPPALASNRELLVTVATESLGVEEAVATIRGRAEHRPAVVRLNSLASLPDRWYGYEGVDAVILAGRPELYAGLTAESPQVVGLHEWVQMGGKLALMAGAQAESLFREKAVCAAFFPGKVQQMISLRQANALELYTGGAAPIPRAEGSRFELRVPQFASVEGNVEAREADLPLVVRRAEGFGQLTFAWVDLDAPPLRDWQGRGLLVRKLVNIHDPLASESHENTALMHYGFDDLAGQLRSALDQFDGVAVVPYWIVVAAVVGYLLLIGPIDYFFLRNVARRWTLTWVTFPLLVLGCCAAAYYLANRFKGDAVRVSQVDLLDVDVATGRLRGSAWANVFSPQADRYNLSFQPQSLAGGASVETLTAWLGLPGEALGGMNPKTVGLSVWREPYEVPPALDSLQGLPIAMWSTRSLSARWTSPSEGRLDVRLNERDQVPVGTITNRLDAPLADCWLCFGRWAYNLGTLEPGRSVEIGPAAQRRDLKTFLTGRRLLIKEERELMTPYEQASTDVAYILRAMMFFEKAGGRQYTGLFNRYQRFVDCSDLLDTGRAILLATAPPRDAMRGATLLRDGQPLAGPQDRHTTMYRFVLPVGAPGR